MIGRSFGVAIAIFGAAVLAAEPAPAQFYAGKTVTFLINFTAGGPTDIEGRIVARHIDKHIPGKPTIVVRNMPGAGGDLGVNYLGEVAKNDPMHMGFFTWNMMSQILGNEGLRIRYENFKFIAGIRSAVVVYGRKDIAPGITRPADIARANQFNAAFLAPDDHSTLRLGLSLDLLKAKHKLIAGYKGVREVATAVEQNEVQVTLASLPAWRSAIEPNFIKPGGGIALYQFDREEADGRFVGHPALTDVPTFLGVYRAVHGADKMPSGMPWEAMRLITRLADSMFRTAFLPPGAPDQAVQDLRRAFAALAIDEAFLAEYEKAVRARPIMVQGADGERIIAGIRTVDPQIVAFLKSFVAEKAR